MRAIDFEIYMYMLFLAVMERDHLDIDISCVIRSVLLSRLVALRDRSIYIGGEKRRFGLEFWDT